MGETYVRTMEPEENLIPIIRAARYNERKHSATMRKLQWSRSAANSLPIIALLVLGTYLMLDFSDSFPFWTISVPLILGGWSAVYRSLVTSGIKKDALSQIEAAERAGQEPPMSRHEVDVRIARSDVQLGALNGTDFSPTKKVILLSGIFVFLSFAVTSVLIMFNTVLEVDGLLRLLVFVGGFTLATVFAVLAMILHGKITANASAVIAARNKDQSA